MIYTHYHQVNAMYVLRHTEDLKVGKDLDTRVVE